MQFFFNLQSPLWELHFRCHKEQPLICDDHIIVIYTAEQKVSRWQPSRISNTAVTESHYLPSILLLKAEWLTTASRWRCIGKKYQSREWLINYGSTSTRAKSLDYVLYRQPKHSTFQTSGRTRLEIAQTTDKRLTRTHILHHIWCLNTFQVFNDSVWVIQDMPRQYFQKTAHKLCLKVCQ